MLCLPGSFEPEKGEAQGRAGRGLCVHLARDCPSNIQFKYPAGWGGFTVLLMEYPAQQCLTAQEKQEVFFDTFT